MEQPLRRQQRRSCDIHGGSSRVGTAKECEKKGCYALYNLAWQSVKDFRKKGWLSAHRGRGRPATFEAVLREKPRRETQRPWTFVGATKGEGFSGFSQSPCVVLST